MFYQLIKIITTHLKLNNKEHVLRKRYLYIISDGSIQRGIPGIQRPDSMRAATRPIPGLPPWCRILIAFLFSRLFLSLGPGYHLFIYILEY